MTWARKTPPTRPEMNAPLADPLVVPVAELAAVLEPYIRIQDMHLKSNGSNVQPLGGIQALAAWSGIKPDTIQSLLRRGRTHVGLGIADLLLAAVGETGALQDGRVHVLASPRWTRAGWEREMLARGLETVEGIL